ncbi:MAG: FixH family protein [Ekhidna sp.]|nr:FixH family protein [Ekhidna sp.]MBC6410144.1 FixH family protein [Ekhidna sp.]
MNWGNRIVLAFICFAGFIGYMVTRAFQEDFDLVAEDYYAQEINYEQKLVKLANTKLTGRSVTIKQEIKHILVEFPDKSAEGTIKLYHLSRELFDKTYEIDLKDGVQLIAKAGLVPGNYRVNINWKAEGQDFLQESKIFIQ